MIYYVVCVPKLALHYKFTKKRLAKKHYQRLKADLVGYQVKFCRYTKFIRGE